MSSRGLVLLKLLPSEGRCLLDVYTFRVLVFSHLQVHLDGVLQSLIILLEGPYTAVCSMSAHYRQEAVEKREEINALVVSRAVEEPRDMHTCRQFV